VNLFINYGLFLAKVITFFIIGAIIIIFSFKISKRKKNARSHLKITLLEDNYKDIQQQILLSTMNDIERKTWLKQAKINNKKIIKNIRQEISNKKEIDFKKKKKILYVIDFNGGVYANEVIGLRKEISAILSVARPKDEVLLRLESSGGVVHGYGLAAAQLNRLRQRGIRLTICIDKVAASGGYMMASVADYIISAPFAIIGSIGVVAQIPNFNKLLKKCFIDIELHTAGDYKRTLTVLGNNTDATRKKFCEELNTTHELFKRFVKEMRPCLDIESVANGEHWFGTIALEKKLVDEINTSDSILISKMKEYTLLNVQYVYSKTILERFTSSIIENISKNLLKIFFYNKKL
jgi:serine protease SohB